MVWFQGDYAMFFNLFHHENIPSHDDFNRIIDQVNAMNIRNCDEKTLHEYDVELSKIAVVVGEAEVTFNHDRENAQNAVNAYNTALGEVKSMQAETIQESDAALKQKLTDDLTQKLNECESLHEKAITSKASMAMAEHVLQELRNSMATASRKIAAARHYNEGHTIPNTAHPTGPAMTDTHMDAAIDNMKSISTLIRKPTSPNALYERISVLTPM